MSQIYKDNTYLLTDRRKQQSEMAGKHAMGHPYQWEDSKLAELAKDPRIIDMAMRLASIPVEEISDGLGQVILEGGIPMPTDKFVQLAGFEYVRRGGRITADIDGMIIARAVLKVRVMPFDELIVLHREVEEVPGSRRMPLIDPAGNGPINQEADVIP